MEKITVAANKLEEFDESMNDANIVYRVHKKNRDGSVVVKVRQSELQKVEEIVKNLK